MEPEGNRHHQGFNASGRLPDARYASNYSGMPQSNLSYLPNYILSMGQMIYPPYPYSAFSCPNPPYYSHMPGWREPPFSHLNLPLDINSQRNFYNHQNLRVIPRDLREKTQSKVINLQSDSQEQKTKNALVPANNNTHKPQKQAQIIQIDQNSDQKNQKIDPAPTVTKADAPSKNIRPQSQVIQKSPLQTQYKRKQKQKQVQIQHKTKQITKIRSKEQKISFKQEKLDKLDKQRKKKLNENEKIKAKQQKQIERSQKKKIAKIQKPQKNEKNQRNEKVEKVEKPQKVEKNEKNDKNRKVLSTEAKGKGQQGYTKQIAKYLQSHGQIRHGKEFQSQLPSTRINNSIYFNKWVQQKREKLLKREVGALTY